LIIVIRPSALNCVSWLYGFWRKLWRWLVCGVLRLT